MKSPSYLQILARQVPSGAVVLRPQPAILQRWQGAAQPSWMPGAAPDSRDSARKEAQLPEAQAEEKERRIQGEQAVPFRAKQESDSNPASRATPTNEPTGTRLTEPLWMQPDPVLPPITETPSVPPLTTPSATRFADFPPEQPGTVTARPSPARSETGEAPNSPDLPPPPRTADPRPVTLLNRPDAAPPYTPRPTEPLAPTALTVATAPTTPTAPPVARQSNGIHIGKLEIEVVPAAPPTAPSPPARRQPVSFAKPSPLSRGASRWLWDQR